VGSIEEALQAQASQSAEDGGDMAVRQRASEMERFAGRDEGFSLQDAAEQIDLGRGPVGEIGEGAFASAAAFAPTLAEQDGGRGVAVGDGLHVHGNTIAQLLLIVK